MLYALAVMLSGAALSPRLLAQNIEIRAFVDRTTVGQDQTVTYTVEIQGATLPDIQRPNAPPTSNLRRLSPVPTTKRQYNFRNGQVSRSLSYEWTFRPQSVGTARIGALTIEVANQTFETEPIELRIATGPPSAGSQSAGNRSTGQPSDRTSPGGDDLFIDVEVSDRSVYVNEPVQLTYRLFFAPDLDVRQSRLSDAWEAEGFWREDVDVRRNPLPEMVVRSGRRYQSIVLKRTVLYPTRSGSLTVAPLRITSEVYDGADRQNPFSRFFSFGRTYEEIPLSSPTIHVSARPLPSGAPPSFDGAVGEFELQTRATRQALEVGGATELIVEVTGSGNVSTLNPPEPAAPEEFDVYDPEVDVSLSPAGPALRGRKQFTYVLVAQEEGAYTLPPIEFSYFNPATEQYSTLYSDSLHLRVAAGAVAADAGSLRTGEPTEPMFESGAWKATSEVPLHRRPLTYVALLAPWLAVLGLLAYRRSRHSFSDDPERARRHTALKRARAGLDEADRLLATGRKNRAFHKSEESLLVFLEDQIGRPLRGLTRPELSSELTAAGIEARHRKDLVSFLRTADEAQFAPAGASRPIGDLWQARKLLESLNQNIAGIKEGEAQSTRQATG